MASVPEGQAPHLAAQASELLAACAREAHWAQRVLSAMALQHLQALGTRGPGRALTRKAFRRRPAAREAEACL